MAALDRRLLLLLLLSSTAAAAKSLHANDVATPTLRVCEPDHLTVYRVICNTFWNDRLFPKHFPLWRPPAQWTKLVGELPSFSFLFFCRFLPSCFTF